MLSGHASAMVACPDCGRCANLMPQSISPDGVVEPLFTCHACAWSGNVQLDSWANPRAGLLGNSGSASSEVE